MKYSKVNQVAAFEKLLGFCNAQGAVYKPSKASIQMAALNSLLIQAQQSLREADVTRTAYENALNARQPVFQSLPKLASRIVDALIASGASPEVVQDAGAIRRRFSSRGKVLIPSAEQIIPPSKLEGPEQGGTYQRRISQLDLASKVENFERLVNRVTAEPLYAPNETELTIDALTTFAIQLRTLNRNVIITYEAMRNSRRTLNAILFSKTGIHGTATVTKAYIRSVFGKGSSQHKEISSYQFTRK